MWPRKFSETASPCGQATSRLSASALTSWSMASWYWARLQCALDTLWCMAAWACRSPSRMAASRPALATVRQSSW